MSFSNAQLTFDWYLHPRSNDHFLTVTLENKVSPEHMRSLAVQLNESKATFLHDLRSHLLQEASFTQEEDIDVERVVGKAVHVFDQNREEILLRIMNENK